ncbi:alpha/beta hydrolase family protein [Nocardioides marmoraquaticus]
MDGQLTRRTALVGALGTLAACSGEQPPEAEPSRSAPSSPSPSATPTTSPTAEPLPTGDRVSLPTLMRQQFDGGRVRRVRRQVVTDAYERWEVTYPAGDTTVSGVLLRPTGRGPFPALVLNHGYIEPSVYVTGQGLAREQDRLAREGFVVLHTDYRGHAASDPAGDLERETRLGYTRDALHAAASLKRLPYVDPDRVGMLGRSMGGGVTLNAIVAQPDLVRAAVVYASVSSRFVDNLRQFTIPGRPEAAQALYDRFGRPEESPDFYAGLSSRTYFDRVEVPLLSLHGTLDDTCPIAWARTTQRLARRAGVDAQLVTYDDGHAFYPTWEASIRRAVRFLRARMDA